MTFQEKFNKAKEISHGRNERLGNLLNDLHSARRRTGTNPKLKARREELTGQIRKVQAELRT